MSAPAKLRARNLALPPSPLLELKKLWREQFTDEDKDWLCSLLVSSVSQPEAREKIWDRFRVRLKFNSQNSQLKAWCLRQQALDAEAAAQAQDEATLRDQFPEWDEDRLRQEVIARSYRRALATGDFKMGLHTVLVDQKERIISLDREKFEHLKSAAAKAAQTEQALDSKLSPEEIQRRIREIYGRA